MNARGRPYRDWMTPGTQMRTLVKANATNSGTYMATALVEFRILLGERASLDKVEVANFQGSEGVSGVILSNWS